MHFTTESFIASLITGSIGFVYWSYGRKRPAPLFMASGALLMVFPYFVESIPLTVIITVALAALPVVVRI